LIDYIPHHLSSQHKALEPIAKCYGCGLYYGSVQWISWLKYRPLAPAVLLIHA